MREELEKLQEQLDHRKVMLLQPKMRIAFAAIVYKNETQETASEIACIRDQLALLQSEIQTWKIEIPKNLGTVSQTLVQITKHASAIDAAFPGLQLQITLSNNKTTPTQHTMNPLGWSIVPGNNNELDICGLRYSFTLPTKVKKQLVKPFPIDDLLAFVHDLQKSCSILLEEEPWNYTELLQNWSHVWNEQQQSRIPFVELHIWLNIWKYTHCGDRVSDEIWNILLPPKNFHDMYHYIQNALNISTQLCTPSDILELDMD